MKKIFKRTLKGGFIHSEIFIILMVIFISVFGILIVREISCREAEKRALQRASDLKMLRREIEKYKATHGNYPSTGFVTSKLEEEERRYKSTYPKERWNECDQPNNWIPGLAINLPHDPSNSCKERRNPYPRYEYVSDGKDYKILSYGLLEEICEREEFQELIDPVRPCGNFDASWAVYSPGAEKW